VLTSANADVVAGYGKPSFEDFVYFAAVQREVDRLQDGVVYVATGSWILALPGNRINHYEPRQINAAVLIRP